jgi:phosphoribosylformylglycinamidine synthase
MPAQHAEVRVLVVTGYGVSAHAEAAHAARLAGAEVADVAHFAEILARRTRLEEYKWLIFPGGFLDGGDLGASLAAAQRWRYSTDADGVRLIDRLKDFIQSGALILGISNGFQLLAKLGLLPALNNAYFEHQVSLGSNASARFENRWVHLHINPNSPCVFTKHIDALYLPARHAEGKLVACDEAALRHLQERNLATLFYADPDFLQPTMEYPYNPSGSPLAIAGLCDPSGRIFGLMAHPEAFTHPTNHPGWGRNEAATLGTVLFENAVRYLRND